MIFGKSKSLSLHKSRNILVLANKWYQKNWQTLPKDQLNLIEERLQNLDQAILQEDREAADKLANAVEGFMKPRSQKSMLMYTSEIIVALILALSIALVVRLMWFEPYEIPTGSMRPTFEEKDHLVVSKTTFGLNVPLATKHFYFDPTLVQRTGIFIFSGDNIDLPDVNTTYFGIFPYTKRYIKRLMGKPGDTVYFYGGKIYALDANGNEVGELLDSPWLKKLEHIPFITFEGRMSQSHQLTGNQAAGQVLIKQMYQPIGKLTFYQGGAQIGEIFNGKNWVKDQPLALKSAHSELQTYSDFWGIRNFAMARLLTKKQVAELTDIDPSGYEHAPLYLELRHQPSLTKPAPHLFKNGYQEIGLVLTPYITLIPLQQEHLDKIMSNMYTARFMVMNGRATKYQQSGPIYNRNSPEFAEVPDGTYEFYYGKAYRVGFGGILYELPADHPLYNHSVENIQKLYNLGMEMSDFFSPHSINQGAFPARYAYFKDGDFYVIGKPLLTKEDPILKAFVKGEEKKEQQSTLQKPYIGFKDYGPPLKDGKIDKEFMQAFGLKIPEKHYMALGDNHAMSADSRYFGFIPEENLQGSPSFIVWPPGPRWGIPSQKPYAWATLPNAVVWGTALGVGVLWYALHRRKLKQPVFRKMSK